MYINVFQTGDTINERYIADGETRVRKIRFEPTLYRHHPTGEFKDIYDRPCTAIQHDSISAARSWMRDMRKSNIEALGMDVFSYQYLFNTYKNQTDFDYAALDIAYVDIEVPTNDGFPKPSICRWETDAVTIYSTKTRKFHVFTTRVWSKEKSVLTVDDHGKATDILDRVEYHYCPDEKTLLASFVKYFRQNTPHILSGWNIDGFDIPYLLGRIKRVLGEKFLQHLSPFKIVDEKITVDDMTEEEVVSYEIRGVNTIDYLPAYKKFTFKTRPNYRLDTIGQVELGMKKLEFSYRNYLEFAEKDPQLYIDYNIRDVDLIVHLDERLSILRLITSVAYYAKINFEDVFSPLKTWDAIIHNSLFDRGIIIPENRSGGKEPYPGAFVKDPVLGLYKWIKSFDLASLYPHIIMGWNISPETIVDQYQLPVCYVNSRPQPDVNKIGLVAGTWTVPHDGNTFAGNGMMYTKTKRGILPTEVEKVFLQRKAAKKAEFYADKVATWAQQILTERHEANIPVAGPLTVTEYDPGFNEENLRQLNDANLENVITLARKMEKMEGVNQQARKVLINSLYGALGNEHFRYFDLRNAEAITMSGQLAIQWIMRKINEFMNKTCGTTDVDYVVYGDTDSVYVRFDTFVELMAKKKGCAVEDIETIRWVNFLDKYSKDIVEPYIDKSYRELADYVNMYEHKMFMDREIIADRAFWTAKKRYAANVWDSEGKRKYDEHGNVVPKLKIMGIETQRSSTPPYASKMLEKSIKTILTKTETDLQELVAEVKANYSSIDYSQIASVSSANNLEQHHKNFEPIKGCPGHVKGAIYFNKLAEKHGADPVQSGDKIQILNLKVPNPLGNVDRIAYPSGTKIPDEFGIDITKYIDYNTMLEKGYMKPLTNICEAIGWKPEKIATLDDIFGDW